MSMPTDEEITRAQRLGSLAAKAGKTLADCPYTEDQRVLKARWALAFADADPDRLVS
jgi:ribosome modulation factor